MALLIERLSPEQQQRILSAGRGELKAICADLGLKYSSVRGALSRFNARQEGLIETQSCPTSDNSEPVRNHPVVDDDPLWNSALDAALGRSQALDTLATIAGVPSQEAEVEDTLSLDAISAIDNADDVYGVPEPLNVIRQEPLWIPGSGNVLVLSDLHCPHQNSLMIRRALHVKTRFFPHVRDVALVGDTFNMGGMSRHPKNTYESSFRDEREIAGHVLRSILRCFDRAWFCLGNHDERMARRWEDADDLEFMINGVLGNDRPNCEVHCSDYDYLYVQHQNPARRWKLVHPSAFSGQGGKTPQEIADLEHINVAAGHNHRVGKTVSRDGKWTAIDLGHMTNPDLHWYVKRRANKYAKWAAGFMILSSGFAHTFWENSTDWSYYGCR